MHEGECRRNWVQILRLQTCKIRRSGRCRGIAGGGGVAINEYSISPTIIGHLWRAGAAGGGWEVADTYSCCCIVGGAECCSETFSGV